MDRATYEADRIKPDRSAVTTFVYDLNEGKYQIPTFQRDIVWEEDNVKKLWDSIYKYYPIGSLLIWDTDQALEFHRKIGGNELKKKNGSGDYQYILDGQQRSAAILLSLMGEKGDMESRKDFNPLLYVDLSYTESEDEEDGKSYKVLFLYEHEIQKKNELKEKYAKGLIVKLYDTYTRRTEIDDQLEEMGYKPSSVPRINLNRFDDILKSYQISYIRLKGIEIREVCDIFERVNREGKPLDSVSIIVAKTYRPSDNGGGFYLRENLGELSSKLEGSQYSKLDDYVVMQIITSIIMQNENTRVKNISSRYMPEVKAEEIEEIWDDAVTAILNTVSLLQYRLNLIGPNLVPWAYMYPPLVNYFFRNRNKDYDLARQWFWHTAFYQEDLQSTTQVKTAIKNLRAYREGTPTEWPAIVLDKSMFRKEKYTAKGARSRAILALMAKHKPCEFGDKDRDVLQSVYLQLGDRPNLHHFFPLGHLDKHPDQANFASNENSLMNIVYLPQLENQAIGDKNPLNYLKPYIDVDPNFDKVLKRHLVPLEIIEWVKDEEATWGNYDRFIDLRTELFIEAIKEVLPDVETKVMDSGER